MRIITDREISNTTLKVYTSWFNISDKLSILDIIVLNRMGFYYDQGMECGLKEMQAELNVSKSRLHKCITRWVDLGFLTEIESQKDKRRRFFMPTELMVNSRDVAFKDIREMHKVLREH